MCWSRHTLWILIALWAGACVFSGREPTLRNAMKQHQTLFIGAPIVVLVKLFFDLPMAILLVALMLMYVLVLNGLARVLLKRSAIVVSRVIVGIALVGGSWFLLRSRGPSAPFSTLPAGATVVCLGDSLTSGIHLDKSGTYPEMLAARTGWNVVNAGVANDTVADALARIGKDVAPHHPDAVLIMIGGNDFMYDTPRAEFQKSLSQLVGNVQSACPRVVLVEVPSGLFTDRLGGAFREVAAEHNVPLLPDTMLRMRFLSGLLLDRLRTDADRETIDGIHLTPRGQQRLADDLAHRLAR